MINFSLFIELLLKLSKLLSFCSISFWLSILLEISLTMNVLLSLLNLFIFETELLLIIVSLLFDIKSRNSASRELLFIPIFLLFLLYSLLFKGIFFFSLILVL